ncbi:MAG TPA: hypothetical protein VKH44_11805, partial [Pirellulaceae bacterium]|nr:hypothetical protein [Pirellulaceae bacterium]
SEIAASAVKPCTCLPQSRLEKNSPAPCITDTEPPPCTDANNPQATHHSPLHLQELSLPGE